MDVISLIQIGDIHFPEVEKEPKRLDYKDASFPKKVGDLIGVSPLQSVIRELGQYTEQNKDSIAGILFCGDLTDKGDLKGYERCISYLNTNMQITNPKIWQPDQIHVVPGNHDIDRDKIDPTETDIFLKFEELVSAWQKFNLPILASRDVRKTNVTIKGIDISIVSLNSCVGCGEKRSLPKKIKDALHNLLHTGPDAFDLIGEQLDTPAFTIEHIDELVSTIESTSQTTISFVLAHHNLLPQTKPRIEIYTEVINGGLVRSRLSQCSKPVIYCHGHIHQDPIEVIISPKYGTGKLISISCPKFEEGFNVIEIHQSHTHIPIGCKVKSFRIEDDGAVRQKPAITIPLRAINESSGITNEIVKTIHSLLNNETIRFDKLRKLVENKLAHSIKPKTLIDALVELEWFGHVTIYDSKEESSHWKIRKITP